MAGGRKIVSLSTTPTGAQQQAIADTENVKFPSASDFNTTSTTGVDVAGSVKANTAKKATNKIRIKFKVVKSVDEKKEYSYAGVAKDGVLEANSIAPLFHQNADDEGTVTGLYEEVAGDTAAHNYSLQVYGEGGTVTVNQNQSNMIFEEIEVI